MSLHSKDALPDRIEAVSIAERAERFFAGVGRSAYKFLMEGLAAAAQPYGFVETREDTNE